MEKKKDTHSHIELRSEKVRHILGEMPPVLMRWGLVVIVAIYAVLIGVLLCVEYPYGGGETIFEHLFFR